MHESKRDTHRPASRQRVVSVANFSIKAPATILSASWRFLSVFSKTWTSRLIWYSDVEVSPASVPVVLTRSG